MNGKIIRIVNTLRKENSFFLEERSNSADMYIHIYIYLRTFARSFPEKPRVRKLTGACVKRDILSRNARATVIEDLNVVCVRCE